MEANRFAEIERLWKLKEGGALTEEEFSRLKGKVLGTAPKSATEETRTSVGAPRVKMAVASVSDERTATPQSLKGCWTGVGLVTLGFVLLVILIPSPAHDGVGSSSPKLALDQDKPDPKLSLEKERREEQARLSEIKNLLREVAVVPDTDHGENERVYSRLAELQPSNDKFEKKRDFYAEKRRNAERYLAAPEQALRVKRLTWWKGGFDSIQLVRLTVENDASFPIRDFELRCAHQAPSGTEIDMNVRTVYELIPAHGSKYVPEVNMGFIHAQVATSSCQITKAVRGYEAIKVPSKRKGGSVPTDVDKNGCSPTLAKQTGGSCA